MNTAKDIFQRAEQAARKGNLEYAIELYIQGLTVNPKASDERQTLHRVEAQLVENNGGNPAGGVGLGRIAELPEPEPLSAFVARVRKALPPTSWGVRASGNPAAPVSRVAVCGGAGDSLLSTVAAAGVQAYVTADLRHHPADEHRRVSDVALVDVAHWASEFPWCAQAADLLRSHFGTSLPVTVCDVRTDPWNIEESGT